jgi:hypothetical protein
MKASVKASPSRLHTHWKALCTRIGERRAGSVGEQAAANYIAQQFAEMGLTNVHAEPFPCVSLRSAQVEVAVGNAGNLQTVPARALAGAPSTRGGKAVEADLIWVEMPEQAERLLTRSVGGKVVVLFGPLPTQVALHKKLVAAKPAAVIHVDDRLPFDWVKDDGVYPTWARRYGMPPTVTIPFLKAWELRKMGANRARVRVAVEQGIGESQNVVGEITGSRPDLPIVLLGAHHDTQCNNVGADDNASGVVGVLELAALLSNGGAGVSPVDQQTRHSPRGGTRTTVNQKHRRDAYATNPKFLRTIRIVSFGTEEQLSVGSAEYVKAHRGEVFDEVGRDRWAHRRDGHPRGLSQPSQIGVVLNIDSVASVLGHQMVIRAGTDEFGAWLMKELARQGFDAQEKTAPMPFADHFPFSVFGIPAVTFHKGNMNFGMRWQHHSIHDNLDNISVDEMARVVDAVAAVTRVLANEPRWKFKRGLAKEQERETMRLARELYDLNLP